MDENTDDISETDTMITAPLGCETCTMGVQIRNGRDIFACANCSHTTRGHRGHRDATRLVVESLVALADVRDLLWPIGKPNASWSPDTIDQVARRLEFLRPQPNYPAADVVRYSGSVRIELSYVDSDGCYGGKVIMVIRTALPSARRRADTVLALLTTRTKPTTVPHMPRFHSRQLTSSGSTDSTSSRPRPRSAWRAG